MLYVFPAIVTIPLRAAPVLVMAVIVTILLPVPLVGDKLTQERFSDEVHEQVELEAVTDTELVPPLEVKLPLLGKMLYIQVTVGSSH